MKALPAQQSMTIAIAAVLGLIQGLCEFLPVSSSGHLLLAEKIFNLPNPEDHLFFTVLLHLGTLIAVLFVYRKRVLEMILHPVRQLKYWIWMIAATAVTFVMYLAFKKFYNAAENGCVLGLCFLFTSALLVMCTLLRRRFGEGEVTIPNMKWYHAAGIGLMQGIALLPGVSRSGATITGATASRMTREDAAEFSFLLSIPAILGSAVMEVPKALKQGTANIDILCCAVGIAVAAVSGYFAVRFMIRLITKRSLIGFAVYTGALGLFVILDKFVFKMIAW